MTEKVIETDYREMTNRPEQHARKLKAPQNFAGGIALISLAGLALWLTRNLDPGTLSAMGSGMLPRILAWAVGLCGIALTVLSFLKDGERLERDNLRGSVLLILAIFAFSVTISPLSVGPLTTPGLGMIVAVPFAIIIGGLASPEARLRELIVLALGLTPCCMFVFCDLLNLPIPVFPRAVAEMFPMDWSQKAILRAVALAMIAAAAIAYLIGRQTGDAAGRVGSE